MNALQELASLHTLLSQIAGGTTKHAFQPPPGPDPNAAMPPGGGAPPPAPPVSIGPPPQQIADPNAMPPGVDPNAAGPPPGGGPGAGAPPSPSIDPGQLAAALSKLNENNTSAMQLAERAHGQVSSLHEQFQQMREEFAVQRALSEQAMKRLSEPQPFAPNTQGV